MNVRFTCDGEEESGGHSIVEFLEADERGGDACVIFDGHLLKPGMPVFEIATRGIAYFHVRVRTGERDLHSGIFGGAALNATHALMQVLAAVLPRDGRLPEPLRAGIVRPSDEEIASWSELDTGAEVLAAQGARPADERAAEELYLRTWVEPAVDVHGLDGGSPQLAEDRAAGRRRGQRLHPARAGSGRQGDRSRDGAPHARGGAGRRGRRDRAPGERPGGARAAGRTPRSASGRTPSSG